MKNQKGISLITLLFTIILMLIITTITMYSGFEAYDNMKVQVYVAKLKTLQEKVDIFCDKYSVKEINTMGTIYSQVPEKDRNALDEVIAMNRLTPLTSWSSVDENTANYRYFSVEAIEKYIGVKDFDLAVWINPLTRNVIAVEGVKIDDIMYYRQYDLPGGQVLEQPVFNTDTQLKATVKTYDNKAEIKLDKKYAKITCKLKDEVTSKESTQVFTHTDTIAITESGKYELVATDYDRNVNDYSEYPDDIKEQYAGLEKTSELLTVAIVNKPMLVEGMTPIDEKGDKITTEEAKQSWYNYGDKKWANAILPDGSIYVWIPRYAYKVAEDVTNPTVYIKFLKEFSEITTEGKVLDNGYKVAPAFQDGTTIVPNSFANGEWDSEITGFWVAKYEVIDNKNDSIASIKTSDSQTLVTNPITAFTMCRKLETREDLFGTIVTNKIGGELGSDGTFPSDGNNIDTHLMKNSEYGAVVYLTNSEFGKDDVVGTQNGYYPGNDYTEAASTTGNDTGIYGLAGGRPEIVSAGINIAGVFNSTDNNRSTKYTTVYSNSSTVNGDAINDTEIVNFTAKDRTFPTGDYPIFTRGGNMADGNIFNYSAIKADNGATSSFRPVIIIEY